MNVILKRKILTNLKSYSALLCLTFISLGIFAQSFDIGHTSVEFYDSIRNRNITTEIYYPANNPGENQPVSIGNFPVLVFGHGFLMGWDSYQNIWTEIVPNGYVICFPTTEMGITPDHQEFGEDLKFLANQMQIETEDVTSLFYNSLASETGLMGHSMGGGASFLAAENNSNIHTLINFAAAETNPSAISAASGVTVPSLIFSGDDDCVAPPIDHQNIMYDSLDSNCKTQIKIINGGHCYFADESPTCSFGESLCNGNLNISRPEQQEVTNDFLNLWLDYSLKGNQNAFTFFNDSIQASNRINYLQNCNTVGLPFFDISIELDVFPNPVIERLNLVIPFEHINGILTINNLFGQQVYQSSIINTDTQIDVSDFAIGSYYLRYTKDSIVQCNKIIKIDR
ncbi:MAG: pimeloyl-ACP methyl ester carboxylesterase [Chitinophagales bacterium]|jgi:pimeloyl-ACP methyl ester carboxylesterase